MQSGAQRCIFGSFRQSDSQSISSVAKFETFTFKRIGLVWLIISVRVIDYANARLFHLGIAFFRLSFCDTALEVLL